MATARPSAGSISTRPTTPPTTSGQITQSPVSPMTIHSLTTTPVTPTQQHPTVAPNKASVITNSPQSLTQPTTPPSATTQPLPSTNSSSVSTKTPPTQFPVTPPKPQNSVPPQAATARRRSSQRPLDLLRLKTAFSPSTHDVIDEATKQNATVRPYLHHRQQRRLWRLSIIEFFITLSLCLTYFGILLGYSREHTINRKHRHIFNSLVTGNALLLGVNIAASLRSYAKMIRWRILAARYRNLREFDLILGCDGIMNVLKLLWHAKWFGLVWFSCIAWIILQLGCAVAVGIVGFAYSLEVSPTYISLRTGNTSVLDLTTFLSDDYLGSLSQIQTWGIRGSGTKFGCSGSTYDDFAAKGCAFLTEYQANDVFRSRLFFQDSNPNLAADGTTQRDVTHRYVDSLTSCISYPVVDGQYGNLSYIIYEDLSGNRVNETIFAQPGPAGLYITANTNSTCGERCTTVTAFQARSLNTTDDIPDGDDGDGYGVSYTYIDTAMRFKCNSTIPQIADDTVSEVDPVYQIEPIISRMLAGMFGWSDAPVKNDTIEYETYSLSTEILYTSTPNTTDMAKAIGSFTMGGIAAMDSDGTTTNHRTIITNGSQPVQAQRLVVKWWAVAAVLGGITLAHFLTLAAVIGFANRAIIKDDSHLSLAKVYFSLLGRVGDHGCILNGDELIDYVGNPKVAWGWSNVRSTAFGNGGSVGKAVPGDIRHADIFEEKSNVKISAQFQEGDYDGVGDMQTESLIRRKTFNAREYF